MLDPGVLGVDVGSVSAAAVLLDGGGAVVRTGYRYHRGKVRSVLASLVDEVGRGPVCAVAITSSSPCLLEEAWTFDPQVSLIAACRRFCPEVRSIIFVGGERFGLIRLDADGAYRGARTNSSCAAGTGSFLDQQARRLGLSSAAELARRALAASGQPPRISTRCAVFARTDLVHAQQAGFPVEEICDGLCRGLAQNIADTLFGGEPPVEPIVLAGGVAQNESVRRHLERIIGAPLVTGPHATLFGALGAALCAIGRGASVEPHLPRLLDQEGTRRYHFPALSFAAAPSASEPRIYSRGAYAERHPVEVELFSPGAPGEATVRLGIDIGSTSTKAILVDTRGQPCAGFYTRTLGSPLTAVQAIGAAVESSAAAWGSRWRITGVGVTGAGRSFIGAVVKADLVVDEITAHARAAYSLDPAIDTIIEIGGQDAKFTTLRDGMVTFSHMNTVCAAGTGSFLEEQAERLGCSLADYERLVQGARAPLSSDRCAVFMERDINSFLAQGFATEEILAAALYSVRENYLSKVARGAGIGQRIAFQGATARNRALVAVFEQGLGKPILVSRYCHLTGALGAALLVSERAGQPAQSTFVGLEALRAGIPVRAETCGLCTNHCRLRVATVAGETVAYGFLCGRDYDAARYVERNTSGFDLFKERRRALAAARGQDGMVTAACAADPGTASVGLPAALGLLSHLPLWQRFFSLLGIPTVTSLDFSGGIEAGRELQGAEFCAPIAALHGHVKHLRGKADWLFLPSLFDAVLPGESSPRLQCYYTQYSAALVSRALGISERCLTPTVRYGASTERTRRELFESLGSTGAWKVTRSAVDQAWETAGREHEAALVLLQKRFVEETVGATSPSVVLLGRPYNVLSPEMGKGIPGIIAALGVKCFSQDMVPVEPRHLERVRPLLESVPWLNGAAILTAAAVAAETPFLYPVFMTSFKCSPDSFIIEYVKRLFDAVGKPYLILQLDDHDSTLGYQTRIEAGIASFRNHAARGGAAKPAAGAAARSLPLVPTALRALEGRTLLFPNWDPLVGPLLCANLRREGVDARLLEEDPVVIRKAMRNNTGQCLPLTIMMQEAVDTARRLDLDPARTAVWVPRSKLACNVGMFTPFMKTLLEAGSGGAERIEVYPGDFFFLDISLRAAVSSYKAYLAGGALRRALCAIRPREMEPGAADRAAREALALLVPAFEGRRSRIAAVRDAAALFDAIPVRPGALPRAAIFGDLYVRDNDTMNQDLARAIEAAGGEAVTTPYTDYIRIIAAAYFRKMREAGDHLQSLGYRALWNTADTIGAGIGAPFARYLMPAAPLDGAGSETFLAAFGMHSDHMGESFENLLKIHHLAQVYPDLALFVQASPGFCCPSLITEAMARTIERLTGIPVVSITYDGTGQYKNDVITPYLAGAAVGRPVRA